MAFGLFKKKRKEESSADTSARYHHLTIESVVPIAKDAVNLIFNKPESDFVYEPGQFITIIQVVNGKKIRRAYSLNSTPFLDENPSVTVKRVEGGAMSNHINDHYDAGEVVQVMEPMGLFTTSYDPAALRSVVCFAGGSGITPLYSLMRSMLVKEPNTIVSLVYCNRSAEYIIFKDELNELKSEYADRFNVIHILEEGPSDYSGRPSAAMIQEVAGELDINGDSEVFICGPQPMMDVVITGLKEASVDESQIRMESFEAGKTSPKEIIADEQSDALVTVLLDGESYDFTVKPGRRILETGLEEGLDMPYSCQSGLCTACRGKVLEGEVTTEGAEGLTQSELDEGYILCCVGMPKTDQVKIEVG
ncbi:MAG: ferredoxin--NADP reductase [Bacteroidota bacterium]